MSQDIEQRVVEMQFENDKFEKGVKQSLGSIDSLKKGLDFKGADKGFAGLQRSANSFDLSNMSKGVSDIAFRFSWLGEQIRNVQNTMFQFAKGAFDALTTRGMMDGFREYELLINSTQTIFSNTSRKGSTLDDINVALSELNDYADLTVYNFGNMTDSIGKFTAAGIGLDSAVSSIKGMSNMAAFFGADNAQLQRAMFQTSQGLATGTIKMMDWRSLQTANMGGEAVQDLMVSVASKMNKKNKNLAKQVAKKGFNETLKSGWLTDDVFAMGMSIFANEIDVEKLKAMKFTDAEIEEFKKLGASAQEAATKVRTITQLVDTMKEKIGSGWSRTWQLIVGDLEQAKELWTMFDSALGPLIESGADSRNKLLEEWSKLGGRADLIVGIKRLLESLTLIVDSLRSAWASVFPKKTGQQLKDITKSFQEWSVGVKKYLTDNKDNLANTFKGLFSVLSIGKGVIDALFGGFKKLVKAILPADFNFLEWTGNLGKWIDNMRQAIEVTDLFNRGVDWIGRVFSGAWEEFKKTELYAKITEAIQPMIDKFNEWKTSVTEFFTALSNPDGSGIEKLLTDIKGWWAGLFAEPSEVAGQEETVEKQVSLIDKIKLALQDFSAALSPVLEPIKNAVNKLFGIGGDGSAEGGDGKPKSTMSFWSLFLGGGAIFLVSKTVLGVIAFIGKFKKAILNIPKAIQGVIESFGGIFDKVGDSIKMKAQAEKIKAIAVAILLIVAAVWILSTIETSKLFLSIGALILVMGAMVGLLFAIDWVSKKAAITGRQMAATAGFMLAIGVSLLLLATSVAILGKLEPLQLIQGALGIAAVLGIIAGFAHIMPKEKDLQKISGIAVPILILAFAMKIIGSMSVGQAATAVVSIAAVLATISGFAHIMPKERDLQKISRVVAPLLILAFAMKIIGSMSVTQAATAVGSIAFILASIAGFAHIMPKEKDLQKISGIAMPILILAFAMKIIGSMSVAQATTAVVGIAAVLASIAGFAHIMPKEKDLKKISGIAVPILILAFSMKIIGSMDVKQAATAVIGIAAVLATVAGFAHIMPKEKKLLGLFAMSGILIAIAGSLKILGSMSIEEIASSVTGLGMVLMTLALFVNSLPKTNMVDFGTMMGLMGAVGGLAGSLVAMGNMGWDKMGVALLGFAGSMAILGIGFAMIKNWKLDARSVGSLMLLTLALALLIPVLKSAATLDFWSTVQGIATLAIALGGLAAVGAIISPLTPMLKAFSMSILAMGAGIILAGAGIMLIASAFSALSMIGAAAITEIMALIPEFFKNLASGVVEFLGIFTASAPALKDALVALIKAGADAIVETSGVLVEALFALINDSLDQLLTQIPTLGNKLFDILIGAIDVLISRMPELLAKGAEAAEAFLQGLTSAFGKFDASQIFKMIGAMGAFIGLFAIMALVGKLAKKSLLSIGVMTLVMAAIVGMIYILASMPVDTVLPVITGLAVLITSLSASMLILSLVPITGALTGIAGLGIFIGGLVTILAVLGGINQIPGFSWLIGEGAKVMAQVGDAIGGFAGAIVGSFAEGISASLPAIGTNLASFWTNAEPFFTGMQGVGGEVFTNISSLATALLALTAADLLQQIGSWITGETDWTSFATQLGALGPAIADFGTAVKDIDNDKVTAATNAASMLGALSGTLPKEGGLLQWIMGSGTDGMTNLSNNLKPFGEAMTAYSTALKDFDPTRVSKADEAAKMIVGLSKEVAPSGGLVQWIMGETSLATLGSQLKLFGDGMAAYSQSLKGVSFVGALASGPVATMLIELQRSLEAEGGIFDYVTGTKDIGKFGDKIKLFGEGLKSFVDNVTGITYVYDPNTGAGAIAAMLNDFEQKLTKEGGLSGWFSGEQSLGAFGEKIASFGEGLNTFQGFAAGIDLKLIENVTASIQSIIDMATLFKTNGGADALTALSGELILFADEIAVALKDSSSKIEESGKLAGETLGKGIRDGLDADITSGESTIALAGRFIAAITTPLTSADNLKKVNTAGTTVAGEVFLGTGSGLDQVGQNGSMYLSNFLAGLSDAILLASILSKSSGIGSDAANGMSKYGPAVAAGINILIGFKDGLSDLAMIKQINDKAYSIGEGAVDNLEKGAAEESPSKTAKKAGVFVGQGFLNGLVVLTRQINQTSYNLGESSVNSMQRAVSRISEVLDAEVDTTPVIRPVLDLSDVTAGAGRISSLFSNRSISLAKVTARDVDTVRDMGQVNKASTSPGVTQVFQQTNNSPKALSRLEIYRQTKNLFATAKGLVGQSQ